MSAVGRLHGKLALITGAGSGIGNAVCKIFQKEGASIAAADIKMIDLCTTSDSNSNSVHPIVADCASSSDVSQMFKSIHRYFDRSPDLVINCAGIANFHLLDEMNEETFDEMIKVNLKSTFLVMREALTLMKQNNISNGSIVNMSSIVGKVGAEGFSHYAATKAGIIGLTKSAAREYGKFGIRCNAVLPGYIDTPMTSFIPEDLHNLVLGQIPMNRMGKPEEIAHACLFLVSDESRYITGSSIEVTGGYNM